MSVKKHKPLYSCWQGMIGRCERPNNPAYKDYGGRGITICSRWSLRNGEGYNNFAADMGDRPTGKTLDRIDNDKGYSPENCRWSTRSEQQLNQRVTRKITIDGVVYKAAEIAKQIGMKTDSVIARAAHGLSMNEIANKEKRVFTAGLAFGGKANGARQKAKTHCPHGHEYNEENTSYTPKNHRICKACKCIKEAKRRLMLQSGA